LIQPDVTRSRDEWKERFERFVAARVALAASVPLPPYVTVIESPPPGAAAVGNAWSTRLFDGPFYMSPVPPGRPACSLVFVQSSDGNTVARDPGSLGGGDTDKHLVYEGLSRVAADAVLAGADTVRGGNVIFSVWHPELIDLRLSLGLPRHPTQIVATIRGVGLDDALLFNVPDVPVVLVTVADGAGRMRDAIDVRPWVTPLVMTGPGDLPRTFERLASMGVGRISCIGGRTLAGQLLDARLVDDVYLTTGMKTGGEPDTPLFAAPWPGRAAVRKRGTGIEAGVTFEHLTPKDEAP
jgi:riboflavin biosynthesis pyrimidine reductase